MNSFFRTKAFKTLLAAIVILPSPVFTYDHINIESKVIFNTTCARCHEGECSGRMSFHLPESAADQHILRHGGELSPQIISQLFELLRYMKEQCSFYPFAQALTQQGIWNSDALAKFHTPSNKAYFIPLGQIEPGDYQLRFKGFNEKTNICVEIINGEFNFIEKESINRETQPNKLNFHIEQQSKHFLRITAQKPISLNQLELAPHK